MKRIVTLLFCFMWVFTMVCFVGQTHAKRRKSPRDSVIELKNYNNIFIGWVDLHPDNWAVHGYHSRDAWSSVIDRLNNAFQAMCKNDYLPDKNIAGAMDKNDQEFGNHDLYIEFSDVRIDYDKYNVYMTIKFIDLKKGMVLYTLPKSAYYGSAWGFENYLQAALEQVAKKVKKVIRSKSVKKIDLEKWVKTGSKRGSSSKKKSSAHQGKFGVYNNIFIGWLDLKPENWALHGYSSREAWSTVIDRMNNAFQASCRVNWLPDREIHGALRKGDGPGANDKLYIRFKDVHVNQKTYKVYMSIHFIDVKTRKELYTVPLKAYYSNAWMFEPTIQASLEEVNKVIQKVITSR